MNIIECAIRPASIFGQSEVHVWSCVPDQLLANADHDALIKVLSGDEQQKLQRFRFPRDQIIYFASHLMLRIVLSKYLGTLPEQVSFKNTTSGRPELDMESAAAIRFNLSHCRGLCVCVITYQIDCGIDIEPVNRESNVMPLARRMFAAQEISLLETCTDADRGEKFINFWTLREAYVKALGTGLGSSAKDFYFRFDQRAPREIDLVHVVSDKVAMDWTLGLFQPAPGFVGAVALRQSRDARINALHEQFTL